jgi:hypothetical protein
VNRVSQHAGRDLERRDTASHAPDAPRRLPARDIRRSANAHACETSIAGAFAHNESVKTSAADEAEIRMIH